MGSSSTYSRVEKILVEEKSDVSRRRISDNTLFIGDIWKQSAQVQVLTCPSGLGKTYNLTMLKNFFDVSTASESKKQFEGSHISKYEGFCEANQGAYPVIYISLDRLANVKPDDFTNQFGAMMVDIYQGYTKVLEEKRFKETPAAKAYFKDELERMKRPASSYIIESSLRRLMRDLYENYEKRVIVLIDDLDKVAASVKEPGLKLIKNWLMHSLENNGDLFFAVIMQSDIFRPRWDLYPDNSIIYTWGDMERCHFSNRFGFSHNDINKLFGPKPKSETLKILDVSGWNHRYESKKVQTAIIDAELAEEGKLSSDLTDIVNSYLLSPLEFSMLRRNSYNI